MASLQASRPGAEVVGRAFVGQYYHTLCCSPGMTSRFYYDRSKLGRADHDGVMSITTTVQAIKEKFLSHGPNYLTAEILTVDAQESHNGGVLVFVTGYLTGKDSLRRRFNQTFFLAPQESGYFILNDVFRYVGEDKVGNKTKTPLNNVVPAEDLPLQKNHIPEQAAIPEEEEEEEEDNEEALLLEQDYVTLSKPNVAETGSNSPKAEGNKRTTRAWKLWRWGLW